MSWSVGRHMEHCWHIIATSVFGIIGVVIMIATLNPGARYFGMFLMVAGPFAGVTYVLLSSLGSRQLTDFSIHVPWETTNVPRPRTKRGALIAITNCVATVSHWFSPYFFVSDLLDFSSSTTVLTVLAPLSRTTLSKCWRLDHSRCRNRDCWLLGNEVVCTEEEQGLSGI